MALSEREELELLELEEKEKGAPTASAQDQNQQPEGAPEMGVGEKLARGALDYAVPAVGALAGGVLGSAAGPAGVVGGTGLGYAAGKEIGDLSKQYILGDAAPSTNPLDQAIRVGTNVAEGAAAEAVGPIATKAASALPNFMHAAVTSPIPQKISDATNLTGQAKGVIGKAARLFAADLPEGKLKTAGDVVTGLVGRHAAYHSPLAPVQLISDAAMGVSKAQSVIAKLLDSTPEKLGKFAPVLKDAATRGANAVATTHFLLGQSDPEYQKIMKDLQEN